MTAFATPSTLADQRADALRRLGEYEPDLRLAPPPAAALRGDPAPPLTTPAALLAEPDANGPGHREIARLLLAVLEVIDRRRPLSQLRHLLGPDALAAVGAAANDPAGHRGYRLARLRLARPSEHAVEIFGTITRGVRVRALAGRMDVEQAAGWRCGCLRVL
jgi:hypothetical protein